MQHNNLNLGTYFVHSQPLYAISSRENHNRRSKNKNALWIVLACEWLLKYYENVFVNYNFQHEYLSWSHLDFESISVWLKKMDLVSIGRQMRFLPEWNPQFGEFISHENILVFLPIHFHKIVIASNSTAL